MAGPPYTNWHKERQTLKTEILKELRDQRDRQATKGATFKDFMVINPQSLGEQGKITILNPQTFGGWRFGAAPSIAFGQIMRDSKQNPFLCQPGVAEWITSGGIIVGFRLGIYTLMQAPSSLTQHTITWMVHGKSSYYKGSSNNENWTHQYDLNETTALLQGNKQVDTN